MVSVYISCCYSNYEILVLIPFIKEADIFSVKDKYTMEELDSIPIKYGYKIKLLQVFDGETFDKDVLPEAVTQEVYEWLIKVERELLKQKEEWARAVYHYFTDNGLFDFDTLSRVPEDKLVSLGFTSPGLKKKFKNKMESYLSEQTKLLPSTSSTQDENISQQAETETTETTKVKAEIKVHKYENVPDITSLFVNGKEATRRAYAYLTEGYKTSQLKDSEITKYEREVLDVLVDDIRAEQINMELLEFYPDYNILVNAAQSISNILPGLIEHHALDKNETTENQKNMYVQKLVRKDQKRRGQTRGILYEKFSRKRHPSNRKSNTLSTSQDEEPSPSGSQTSEPSTSQPPAQKRRLSSKAQTPKNVSI